MNDITLAIDPGKTGAFAWVSRAGHLIDVADMPTIDVRGKSRICASGIADLMQQRPVCSIVIEEIGTRPGESPIAARSFGYGAGLLEGVATGLCIPVRIISASVWKRKAGVPADKGAVCEMAVRLWPGASAMFKGSRGGLKDGRADAALMGRWAAMGGVL